MRGRTRRDAQRAICSPMPAVLQHLSAPKPRRTVCVRHVVADLGSRTDEPNAPGRRSGWFCGVLSVAERATRIHVPHRTIGRPTDRGWGIWVLLSLALWEKHHYRRWQS